MNLSTHAPTSNLVSSRTVIVTCLGIGTLFFIINDLLGLINGGGLFSAMAAIRAAHSHKSSLDVDGASLRTLFVVICAFLTTTSCMRLRLDINKRWTQLIFIICIIGGGFVSDAVFGPRMIESYLGRNGYRRCSVQDHTAGSGKGRVWFDNYVFKDAKCVRSE